MAKKIISRKELISQIKEAQKDPAFIKAIRKFIRLTTTVHSSHR